MGRTFPPAQASYFDIPWDVVKNIEKSQLAKDYAKIPLNKVTALGIDEICVFHHAKSDEKYLTVVRNLETGEVLFVGDGKGVKALEGFAKRIRRWRRHMRCVCMEMANAYAKWAGECLSDAHRLKEQLRGIYEVARYAFGARLLLDDWCATARATGVPELMSMADTVERHLDGILGYWKYGRASNAKTEGFNNKIRWLIRQAYGFRDRECFKLKIYALPDTETTKSP